jgi:hypothetical protein
MVACWDHTEQEDQHSTWIHDFQDGLSPRKRGRWEWMLSLEFIFGDCSKLRISEKISAL